VRNKTFNHNSGKAYKPRALKKLNGKYNDSRLNLQRHCPPLNNMSGNNNIEKKNTMKAMKMVVRGKKGSNPQEKTKYLINTHFTICRILGDNGKLDKWTSAQVESFKTHNEDIFIIL
jgi:hypothetical protein